ncbi:MAG: AraC family transcriptional regulator ligand-binding domain-containing protein [Alcanivoracaceae bacterium]|jgi:AraC-like DNA-binding protein|nr:AraC family transcriptional regulator ligand-binding domain-containing protein [Alcanivoracaceae bacterium]
MDQRQPTVTLRFAQAIRQAAARLGIDLPVAQADGERVPLAAQDALWEAFCSAAQEPLIGLRLGLELQAGHLDLAGLLLMTCETYGESLDALLEYYPIVGEGGDFSLQIVRDEVCLSYHAHYHVRMAERVETVIAALLNLSHWNSGGGFQASRVELCHRPLDEPSRYHQLLGCPVTFNSAVNSICFPQSMLSLPLIQANAAMRDQLLKLADSQLSQLGDNSLSRQVAALICEQPRWGKEKVADSMGMSGRHLIRLLADERMSFKQIRDRELLRLAQRALQEEIRISDVALQLGFSDESAFAKAFRRWTGMSPGQYRDHCA